MFSELGPAARGIRSREASASGYGTSVSSGKKVSGVDRMLIPS